MLCKRAFPVLSQRNESEEELKHEPIPEFLFLGLTQISDDIRFLRKMVLVSRECLLRVISVDQPWTVLGTKDITPGVSCRFYRRWILDWEHVCKTEWPHESRRLVPPKEVLGIDHVVYGCRVVLLP